MVKSDLMDTYTITVGQSPSGLWYTCVHAKQLLINPMYMWVEKKILPIPETIQVKSTSAETKEGRRKKKKKN